MRYPIRYNFGQGQLLYALLAQEPAGIKVWLELPDGSFYADFSVPAPGVPLARNEFVARTWGDYKGLMASAMMGTGLFQRTGKEIAHPVEEVNEIWQLSSGGVEWVVAITKEDHVI
jgi:hypothetical protein